ncbi:MAG: DUF6438 domain-containing protein [Methylovulum miyakonense]|uniref:DUF6438 domain-containing protein n=1 Tax=Methylovulum miyakonense TaxID=645578 RepID=UPI003BB6A9D0
MNVISNTPPSICFTHLILLGFLLFFSVSIISFAEESPVLVLSSWGRTIDGPLPTYTFEIYRDGSVHYHGEVKVKVIGDRQAKITPKQVQQLIATYRKIDDIFKEYERDKGYKLTGGHADHYIFQLQYQGETSKLVVGGFANDMFINLNKMIPIKSWICFAENDPLSERTDSDCPLHLLGKPIYPID